MSYQSSWEKVEKFDDTVPPGERELTKQVLSEAVDRCDLLRAKGEFFHYCRMRCVDKGEQVSDKNPVYLNRVLTSDMSTYCTQTPERRCPEWKSNLERRKTEYEQELRRECEEQGILYIPPLTRNTDFRITILDNHARILGRNYPVAEFQDRGKARKMPYTMMRGKKIPIIGASSMLVREEAHYLLVQEKKRGSGDKRIDRFKWDLPGGGIEDEDFMTCAEREFREETGLEAKATELIGLMQRISKNERMVFKAVYVGELTPKSRRVLHQDVWGCGLFSLEQIRRLFIEGDLKSPDILLLANRSDQGMTKPLSSLGEEGEKIWIGHD
ncbi:TPA: NUDIX hydrolase [Candidatus Woesearchaeota archaeon]|nr:NUDIX hydrolase [Candidatus Woesearchaeota archaeon]